MPWSGWTVTSKERGSPSTSVAVRVTGRAVSSGVERFQCYTLLELGLLTGRTHQIRVHMGFIGHPVAGDVQYGGAEGELGLSSQALHAARLEFDHPVSGERMSFESRPGAEFEGALARLR